MLIDLILTVQQSAAWTQLTVRKQLKRTVPTELQVFGPRSLHLYNMLEIDLTDAHPNMVPASDLRPIMHSHPDYIWSPACRGKRTSWYVAAHPKFTPLIAMDYIKDHDPLRVDQDPWRLGYALGWHSAMWVCHNKNIQYDTWSKMSSKDDHLDYLEYSYFHKMQWSWLAQLKWRYEFFTSTTCDKATHAVRSAIAAMLDRSDLDRIQSARFELFSTVIQVKVVSRS